jgi:hypothetical protein
VIAPGRLRLSSLAALIVLGACTTVPTGPSVPVLPGTGKSFDQFRADDAACQQYALAQVGGMTPDQAATGSGVRSAAVGAAVGAAAGAALGGHEGAGVGAGTGLVVGSLAGAGAAQTSAYDTQRRYDLSYIQCMYAKGHRVPVLGHMAVRPAQPSSPPPPPPPGSAPPPGAPLR